PVHIPKRRGAPPPNPRPPRATETAAHRGARERARRRQVVRRQRLLALALLALALAAVALSVTLATGGRSSPRREHAGAALARSTATKKSSNAKSPPSAFAVGL